MTYHTIFKDRMQVSSRIQFINSTDVLHLWISYFLGGYELFCSLYREEK